MRSIRAPIAIMVSAGSGHSGRFAEYSLQRHPQCSGIVEQQTEQKCDYKAGNYSRYRISGDAFADCCFTLFVHKKMCPVVQPNSNDQAESQSDDALHRRICCGGGLPKHDQNHPGNVESKATSKPCNESNSLLFHSDPPLGYGDSHQEVMNGFRFFRCSLVFHGVIFSESAHFPSLLSLQDCDQQLGGRAAFDQKGVGPGGQGFGA